MKHHKLIDNEDLTIDEKNQSNFLNIHRIKLYPDKTKHHKSKLLFYLGLYQQNIKMDDRRCYFANIDDFLNLLYESIEITLWLNRDDQTLYMVDLRIF